MAIILALIVFLLFQLLIQAAGVLGIWLAIVVVPAYFRYLLYLLEARANGRTAPSPGIELFNWVENFWSLFPLVLVSLLIWGGYFLANKYSFAIAAVPGVLILFIFPASMAVLAVTRSPIESLNPAALFVLIKACGRDYLMVPLIIVAMGFLIWTLMILNMPGVLIMAAVMYASILLFTLTGAVLYENGSSIAVDIPPPLEPGAEQLEAELTSARTKVLNHAYGFISRGNRQGGLQHVYDWIGKEADVNAAYRWFFEQMLKWESSEAALVFAQEYLAWLLDRRHDIEAIKLINRCLMEDARFKPLPGTSSAALAAAERQANDELCAYLRR